MCIHIIALIFPFGHISYYTPYALLRFQVGTYRISHLVSFLIHILIIKRI